MMRPDRFTEQAQEVIAASQELVRNYRHNQWDVEHVLMALLQKDDSVPADILRELGVDIEQLKGKLEQTLQRSPKTAYEGGQIYATPRIASVFQTAPNEADRLKDEFVSSEHLFIAIAGERDGESAKILRESGMGQEKIYRALQRIRGGQRVTDPRAESKYRALEKYSRDLTMLAREGKLDPVIGGAEEVGRGRRGLPRPAPRERRGCGPGRGPRGAPRRRGAAVLVGGGGVVFETRAPFPLTAPDD